MLLRKARWLYDYSFYEGKFLSFYSIGQKNSNISCKIYLFFPLHKKIVLNCWSNLSSSLNILSGILSQYLWYNGKIQDGDSPVHSVNASEKHKNFLSWKLRVMWRKNTTKAIKDGQSFWSMTIIIYADTSEL